jgi:hypothetical protein
VEAKGTISTLNIQRIHARYFLSSEHPSPESVKKHLDETIPADISHALNSLISIFFSDTDPSIWLIRRLELQTDINAAWKTDQIAKIWAEQITHNLTAIFKAGQDGQNALWFPDRAVYLARFLSDLAKGRAWNKWYYKSFDGLRMLTVSAALRTAICDQPGTGLDALIYLSAHDQDNVLKSLTLQDARRVLGDIACHFPAEDTVACFKALWENLEKSEFIPLSAGEEIRHAIKLYLKMCVIQKDLSGPALKTAILTLLRLSKQIAGLEPQQGRVFINLLGNSDLPGIYKTIGWNEAETIIPITHCSAEWIKEVGHSLLNLYKGQFEYEPLDQTDVKHTSFGGIFLLLPLLNELPMERATRNWPDLKQNSAISLLRFLILMKSLGREKAGKLFYDPFVRDLFGIEPTLSPSIFSNWQSKIRPTHLEQLLKENFSWHRKQGAIEYKAFVLVNIPMHGASAALLVDCKRGLWVCARGYKPNHLDGLVDWLRPWLSELDSEKVILICDNIFFETMRTVWPCIKVKARASPSISKLAETDSTLAEALARLDSIPHDQTYLSLSKPFNFSRYFDFTLSIVAQNILRGFASRLPGFAGSSLPYLYTNFLDFTASIEKEPERSVVRIGRPPLNLVLNMTGINRNTYNLSWLDKRPFVLFQED